MAEKQLGMKWFHFLIYFVLWANAAILILSSLSYFTGGIYESPSQVYTQYPALQLIDMLYGAAMCCFGVFCIITRSKLAKFKVGAPNLVYVFYIFGNIVLPIAYNVIALIAIGSVGDVIPTLTDPYMIGTIVGTIIVVALNKVYFNKRAHLFVN